MTCDVPPTCVSVSPGLNMTGTLLYVSDDNVWEDESVDDNVWDDNFLDNDVWVDLGQMNDR